MKTKFNRILSMLLVCMMVLTSPLSILAAEFGDGTEQLFAVETQADAFTDSGEAFDAEGDSAETPELFSDEEEPLSELGGSGTQDDPYLIKTADDVPEEIAQGVFYALADDIVLNPGQQIKNINGTLDGKGHVITLGGTTLAASVRGTIQNLGVTGNLVAKASFAGNLSSGKILNCYSTATMDASSLSYYGGCIADGVVGGTINNVYYAGTITSPKSILGGITGDNRAGQYANCYYTDASKIFGNSYSSFPTCGKKTLEELQTTGAELLNNNVSSTGFTWTTISGVNNGLPVLTDGTERPGEEDTAEKLVEFINSLPEIKDLTLNDRGRVTNARERYEALSEDEQKNVPEEVLEKLKEAEERLEKLANPDWVEAEKVNEILRKLPEPEEVELKDKKAVQDAETAYTALSEAQQSYIEEELYEKLDNLKTKIGEMEVKAVVDSINALPEVDALTLASKADVEKARELYDALDDSLKETVDAEALVKLEAAEAKIQELTEAGENASDSFDEKDEYLGVSTKAQVYGDFQNDLWLQFQQKEMKVGETAIFYPWRLEQAVVDTIHNDVQRPNFHFEIIKGDSIELDKTVSSEYANVTAVKTGTTVVKVTYDAFHHTAGRDFGAISDVNIGYAVFTVNENGTVEPVCSSNFTNWRHYDTVYYNEGTTVPFTFTALANGAERIKVTLNGKEIQGHNGSYTANLENRNNIIGVTAYDKDGNKQSVYRVVKARFIDVNVKNKSEKKALIEAGDTAVVSFNGITMPVYKLASIYNPCWTSNGAFGNSQAAYVSYRNEKLGEFKGECKQWDLATNNSFEVPFEEAGSYTFTSEEGRGIFSEWWGDQLGSDTWKMGAGDQNTSAAQVRGWFSSFPSFTIEVAESSGEPEEPEGPDMSSVREAEKEINALPETEKLTLDNERGIENARAVYNALGEEEKTALSADAYNKLTEAENKLAELKANETEVEPAVPGEGEISVYFRLLGDDVHKNTDEAEHTFTKGNLTTWIPRKSYAVSEGSRVIDLIKMVLEENDMSCTTKPGDNYISSITRDGVKLAEFSNGSLSGWMYHLNGYHSNLGVGEQLLSDGDEIIFHYTDDYTNESHVHQWAKEWSYDEAHHWHECVWETDDDNTWKYGYGSHEWNDDGICTVCGYNKLTPEEAIISRIEKIGEVTYTEDCLTKIQAARAAYDAADEDVQEQVTNVETLTEAETKFEALKEEALENAKSKITALKSAEDISASDEAAVKEARSAYDALLTAEKNSFDAELKAKLEAAEARIEELRVVWNEVLEGTDDVVSVMERIITTTREPSVGSEGGEWAVLALARSGNMTDTIRNNYLNSLRDALKGKPTGAVKLDDDKPTENERVILALGSLGIDASDFEGYDFVSPIQTDAAWVKEQGTNAVIYAIIALNSKGFEGSELYIEELLELQHTDGGWGLSNASEMDITAMAVQALARDYTDAARRRSVNRAAASVTEAVDSAVDWLSGEAIESSETAAQIITALTAINIDPQEDERFQKEGSNPVTELLKYYDAETGAFRHKLDGKVNTMATEQAAYALAAYQRYQEGDKPLYDMSDVPATDPTPSPEPTPDPNPTPSPEPTPDPNPTPNPEPTPDPNPTPSPVDKTELSALISKAEKLKETDYTADSWKTFASALTNAKSLNTSTDATQSQVNLAKSILQKAIDGLVEKDTEKSVTVSFTLVGDSKHDSPSSHTAFQTWIPKKTVTITGTSSATVWEIMQKAAEGTGVSYHNRGNYIDYITYNGVQLGEFDNGPNSGWMYTVNGSYPDLGVEQKLVVTGDDIYFHYTDNYNNENTDWNHSHSWSSSWSHDAAAHWHECLASGCGITDNTKKNGYAAHTWDEGKKGEDGKVTYTCKVCGYTKTEDPENPDKPVDPENPDKPVEVKVPVVDTITTEGNKVTVTLKEELEGMDGYDFVIGNAKDCITTKDYAQVNKNVTGTKTSFYYVGKGKHCVYVHAYKRVNGKKVFSGWSKLRTFKVTAVTPATPEIKSVKQKGSTVTVTYTKCKNATGYDVVLGSAVKKVNGEKRPVEYGKLVSKVTKGNVVKATFKNVKKGKYYVGLHAYNRTSEDNKKVFSPWSRTKTFTVKAAK